MAVMILSLCLLYNDLRRHNHRIMAVRETQGFHDCVEVCHDSVRVPYWIRTYGNRKNGSMVPGQNTVSRRHGLSICDGNRAWGE